MSTETDGEPTIYFGGGEAVEIVNVEITEEVDRHGDSYQQWWVDLGSRMERSVRNSIRR